jgi:hypothetical protein
VLGNDSDADGDPLSLSGNINGSMPTQRGSVYFRSDGSFSYYPQYAGIDSFSYTVCDDKGGCSTGTVNVLNPEGDDENSGTASCNAHVGAPVNVTNGNMYLQQTDYHLPGIGNALDITRTYNSNSQHVNLFGL